MCNDHRYTIMQLVYEQGFAERIHSCMNCKDILIRETHLFDNVYLAKMCVFMLILIAACTILIVVTFPS